MKTIKVGTNYTAKVDDEDYDVLSKLIWVAHKVHTGQVYASHPTPRRFGKAINFSMHGLLMSPVPKGLEVDHIDGNGLNNQKSNLRLCTHSQNVMNRKLNKNNKSGIKGVDFHAASRKWRARIRTKTKLIHLGCFLEKEDAVKAYEEAARKYHGEFSRISPQKHHSFV